jgi:small-conductance mechanosensitive channel
MMSSFHDDSGVSSREVFPDAVKTSPHYTFGAGEASMSVIAKSARAVAMLAALLAIGPVVHAQTSTPGTSSQDDEVATAPVDIDGATLFRVRGASSYPAETRAAIIRDRIVSAATDASLPIDALRVEESQGRLLIMARDVPLMGVTAADASLEQVSAADYAQAHLMRIRQAITQYRTARSAQALRAAAGRTAIATIVLAIGIIVLLWLWRLFDALLTRRLHTRIHSVGIQSFEVMRAEQIWAAVRNAFITIRTLTLAAGVFVYLGIVLAHWPWTRGLSRGLFGLALGPLQVLGLGFIANIPRFVFLAVLFLLTRFTLKIIRLFFEAVGRGTVALSGFDAEWAEPTYKIVRIAVVALALVVAYPYIPGSESAAFKGVSLFIGILFSLGSSTAVANIIAGYMMTYRRAFRLGDRVRIGDTVGDVVQMRLQVTHLRTAKNEEVVIPNSQILGGEVLNYSSLAHSHGLLLHTEVGIGYETPWRQVEAMLLEAARRTNGLGTEPRPFVLLKRLGDFAVTYELNAPCVEVKAMNPLYSALHRNILDVFNEYGVQIMTPAYEGDTELPKVVAPKDWFAAPAVAPTAAASVSSVPSV